MAREFDLIVLGGGPAGIAGAVAAGAFGKRAALVEQDEFVGGAGINTGTVPSKTLRESALLLSGWRSRKLLGVDVRVRDGVRLAEFMHHERHVVAEERSQMEKRMAHFGVERFRGRGRFVDPHTIEIAGTSGAPQTIAGERILIATGSSPAHPPEFDFDSPRVHDSNEILEIGAMPDVLVVVGAGVIGSEYACTFAALGVEVHVVDGRDALLAHLDPDLSTTLDAAMRAAGVHFHWKERVTRCEAGIDGVHLWLSSGAEIAANDVLVAAGRTSNTADLGLEKAGLVPGERGLLDVDERFRTKVTHVYAAGDVIGPPALAGTGMEQARLAICHAFECFDKQGTTLLPTGIYTIPEISTVGETERSMAAAGTPCIVGRANYAHSARGQIIGDELGFLKLVFRTGDMRLVGVHALGEQATELVHVGLVAMQCNADVELFDRICFNVPTLGNLYKTAAYDALLQKLGRRAPNVSPLEKR